MSETPRPDPVEETAGEQTGFFGAEQARLAEEIPPEKADPEEPERPFEPFVLQIPKWDILTQSPIFTYQGDRMLNLVAQVHTNVAANFGNFMAGFNLGQGGSGPLATWPFEGSGPEIEPDPGLGAGGGTWGQPGYHIPGTGWGGWGGWENWGGGGGRVTPVPGAGVIDPGEQEILQHAQKLLNERGVIDNDRKRGLAADSHIARAKEIDGQLATLFGRGVELPSVKVGDDELRSGVEAFVNSLAVMAVAIKDPEARAAVGEHMARVNAEAVNSVLVNNLGALEGAFDHS